MRGRTTDRQRGAQFAFDTSLAALGEDLPLFPELCMPLDQVMQWLAIAVEANSVIVQEQMASRYPGQARRAGRGVAPAESGSRESSLVNRIAPVDTAQVTGGQVRRSHTPRSVLSASAESSPLPLLTASCSEVADV